MEPVVMVANSSWQPQTPCNSTEVEAFETVILAVNAPAPTTVTDSEVAVT